MNLTKTVYNLNRAVFVLNVGAGVFDVSMGSPWMAAIAATAAGVSAAAAHIMWRQLQLQPLTGERPQTWAVPVATPPTANRDTTLGYRYWVWNVTKGELSSPVQCTVWHGPELRCEDWDERDVVRGHAGIHAALLPPDWLSEHSPEVPAFAARRAQIVIEDGEPQVTIMVAGVVERFGKYVLGSEGWRAEWVVIRKLIAPTEEVGLSLERAFPDVEVIYV